MTATVAVRQVNHWFGKQQALDRVDLTLEAGQVLALLGPNGAGKTTLVRILLGLIPPADGEVKLWGHRPGSTAVRRRIGAMLQVGRIPETLTVAEHVRLFSSYYGTPVPVDETLRTVGLLDVRDRWVGQLSGGQRQRALFALAICGRPDLLILDEPTVGLDVESRRAFWVAVRTMIAHGCAVLLTTHYLEEADAVADRLAILRQGRIIANGAPAAIKRRLGGKKIRCRTTLPVERVAGIHGVRSLSRDGDAVVLLSDQAERVVGELLARDPTLSDLEVTGAGLEEAFMALTSLSSEGGSDVDVLAH